MAVAEWRDVESVHTPNLTDRAGAMLLKQKIEAFWAARGKTVNIVLVEAPFTQAVRAARVDVRSDMINALPRPARS